MAPPIDPDVSNLNPGVCVLFAAILHHLEGDELLAELIRQVENGELSRSGIGDLDGSSSRDEALKALREVDAVLALL